MKYFLGYIEDVWSNLEKNWNTFDKYAMINFVMYKNHTGDDIENY